MVPDENGLNERGRTSAQSGPAVIFPLLSERGNRRVLTHWIHDHDEYGLVRDPTDLLTAEYDCLILDRQSLVEQQDEVRERKEREPVLLPVVLLVEQSEERQVREELRKRPGLRAAVDAVVTIPIADDRFADQLNLLLQSREQSAKIAVQRGELGILNRVLRHDIRNDLNVMLGWAEILEDHVDDEGQEFIDRITHSGRHIVELTEVARDIAEAIASGEGVELEPVDLTHVLTEEVTKRKEMFDDATIEIREPPDPATTVLANEMLASVFRNLINNAVQHNDSDTPTVEITAVERDDSVVVRIADNGPGISDDLKDRIFEEAHKGLDSAGTGLGLYLVQSLLSAYRGSVWVEDNDPRGAVFAVELVTTEQHPKDNA